MEPTEHNRRAWDELHRGRADPLAGETGLPPQVHRALKALKGKRALSLQSGSGEAAGALAELGATVTAVDDSEAALAAARERWPSILWIHGDVQSPPREVQRGRFDLVYTGPGVLDRIRDLDAWARGVELALGTGGDLLLFDEHPVARCVDGLMHWRESYFGEGPHGRRLGQVVSAIARAGLVIRALEEYPQAQGNQRHHDPRVPGSFLLHAQRP